MEHEYFTLLVFGNNQSVHCSKYFSKTPSLKERKAVCCYNSLVRKSNVLRSANLRGLKVEGKRTKNNLFEDFSLNVTVAKKTTQIEPQKITRQFSPVNHKL